MLQEHVVFGRKPDAGTHDVDQAPALSEERVHHCARKRREGGERANTSTRAREREREGQDTFVKTII